MNVVSKKNNLVFLFLTAVLVSPSNGNAQDLFDDSFLNNPENRSISVSTSEVVSTPSAPSSMPMGAIAPVGVDASVTSGNADLNPVLDNSLNDVTKPPVVSVPVKTAPEAPVAVSKPKVVPLSIDTDKEIIKPSDKVIGTLSKEMFHEMADLEKENSLLNLQLKQEKLKSQINSVKALQRQTLMDEIEKRELAARARVEWEQEQELKTIELWEKRQKAEYLSKQIEDIVEGKSVEGVSGINASMATGSSQNSAAAEEKKFVASEVYYIVEIRGLDGNLGAKIADDEEKKVFFVKIGSFLPTGHKVVDISKDHVKVSLDDKEEIIGFSIVQED